VRYVGPRIASVEVMKGNALIIRVSVMLGVGHNPCQKRDASNSKWFINNEFN
jgi:hypothetical protein